MLKEAWGRMRDCAAVGATLPLGAGVAVGRWVLDAFSRLVGAVGPDRRRPHHNEGMVREQVRAAARAARAAGVFKDRKTRKR